MSALLAVLALAALPASAPCDPDELGLEVVSLVTVADVVGARRAAVFRDAVEARIVRGTFGAPRAGDALGSPGDEARVWTAAALEHDPASGWYRGPALRSGWARLVLRSERARPLVLDTRGARHLYVNGEPRAADYYGRGWHRVPIALVEGENELLVRGGRGALALRFEEPPRDVFLGALDVTLGDFVRGESAPLWVGVHAFNATGAWARDVRVTARVAGAEPLVSACGSLAPVSARKLAVLVPRPAELDGVDEVSVALRLESDAGGAHELELVLSVRDPHERHLRTFRSELDGGVQYYGVAPPPPREPGTPGVAPALVLALHGASVPASNVPPQYRQREGVVVVAPTNRREFGFDWEEQGRLDALEVLAHAERLFGTDPRRTYVTGHSMGGHGAWHLGVHYPDRFAAVAPSAGWRDFWSYGGALELADDAHEVDRLLLRATNASRTLLFERNLLHGGVYVLHGERDDDVPVEQARFMRERLAAFHPNFAYYERPGAGHWWGSECMDWPPLFDFLAQNVLPAPEDVRRLEFRTASPAISSRCFWIDVRAQERSMEPSSVVARVEADPRRVVVETQNVARLALDPVHAEGEPVALAIDGEELTWPAGGGRARLERADGAWRVLAPAEEERGKTPAVCGPFEEAFRRRALLVAGTRGSREENAWALARARYDAATFAYRGNGAFEVVTDVEWLARDDAAGRGVVLYGNRDTNAAYERLVTGPIDVRRGEVRIGERVREGAERACLFVRPLPGGDGLVGVVGGTGLVGMRLTNQLPYFVSGVGYPDWTVLEPALLEGAPDGVRAAGWFDARWALGDDWSVRE